MNRQEKRSEMKREDELTRLVEEAKHKVEAKSVFTKVKQPVNEYRYFDGNIIEWEVFWDSFQRVHIDVSIPDNSKLALLNKHVVGKANDLIKNLSYTIGTYKQAVDILKDKYGKLERLEAIHLGALHSLPACRLEGFEIGC